MGTTYSEINDKHELFIKKQKLFFVGSATQDSMINISPKGMDSLKIIDKNRIAWLNVTGSGNETSAHIQKDSRMTIMFSAFEGDPMILRLYGHAKVIHFSDDEWEALYSLFSPLPGARQIFDFNVDLVQVSCGMSVPYYDYVSERNQLKNWALKKGNEGIKEYWAKKNQTSLDGIPTHIVEKNT